MSIERKSESYQRLCQWQIELRLLCDYYKRQTSNYYSLIAYEALRKLNAPVSRIINGTRPPTTKRILNDMVRCLARLRQQVAFCEWVSKDVTILYDALVAAFPEEDTIQLEVFDTKDYEVQRPPKKRRWK